jgi:hypothetical protein
MQACRKVEGNAHFSASAWDHVHQNIMSVGSSTIVNMMEGLVDWNEGYVGLRRRLIRDALRLDH